MALAAHAARVAAPTSARLRDRRWSSLCGLVVAGLLLGWTRQGSAAPPTPAFDDPSPMTSHDGVAQLSWPGPLGDYEVRLDLLQTDQGHAPTSSHSHSRVVYRGRMPSAHLSGLREGDYAVQVRAHGEGGWSPWSGAKLVTVRHHPLPLVYVLMALGLLTFAGTAAVVLRSSRRAS